MSKNTKVKMVEVVALHDLSYLDHNKEPQYKRQSSRPFPLDEANALQFAARKAVRLVGGEVAQEAAVNPVNAEAERLEAERLEAERLEAERLAAEEAARAEAEANTTNSDDINADESADADAAGDDFADDFADENKQDESNSKPQGRGGRRGR